MGYIVLFAIMWLCVQIGKESNLRQAPRGTDFTAASADAFRNNLSQKEVRRRIDSGRYVKK